ncbi:MFS transporter prlL [Teratosphaeria destructans]|uniref:MFS transporter prlL n=1 Tax=Teratosphaeria destructans TaxID=418781 RepID=A0A9W7SL99_9PEZI|nr:MFS transporter prlL [Teratosphaeria destructans]
MYFFLGNLLSLGLDLGLSDVIRHCVCADLTGRRLNRLKSRCPLTERSFGIIEDLAGLLALCECRALLTRDNWSIVEHVEESSRVFGEDDLLLGTFDDRRGMRVVCLLELLAGNVGELGFGDQGLSLGTNELLLKSDQFGRLGLLVLQLLNLILNLQWMSANCRTHATQPL